MSCPELAGAGGEPTGPAGRTDPRPRWVLGIRHLRPRAEPGACLGHADPPLASDVDPAAAAAAWQARIRALTGALSADELELWASDLERARATAAPLAARLGVPVRVDRRLRELDFGAWEGLTWPEIERRDPARAAAWFADWAHAAAPGGESWAGLAARVAGWWGALAGPRALIVVAHHGSLRALWAALLGLPPSAAFDHRWCHGSLAALRCDPGRGWRVPPWD